ncbi:MAG: succinate dehydrogenase, cytochrome b556 subunit [Hyphomicrobiaceae bacterium]
MSLPVEMPRQTGHRRDPLWVAALMHRISGILLACFLPFHFLALGLAIEGESKLAGFLTWTDNPTVKFAETGLIFLLAIHLLGGIRVLLIENLPWEPNQKRLATITVLMSILLAALFLLRVL